MAKDKGQILKFKRRNLLEESRKKYSDLLDISPFQVLITIPYQTPVKSDKPLIETGNGVIDKEQTDINRKIGQLAEKIADLQEKEQKGDEKAASKADSELKNVNRDIKELLGDLNTEVREAVEDAIKKYDKANENLRAVGRNSCKEIKIKRGVFSGAANVEAIEDLGEAADALEGAGDELLKQSKRAGALRGKLIAALETCYGVIDEALKKSSGKPDLKQIAKDNSKVFRDVEGAGKDYQQELDAAGGQVQRAEGVLKDLDKLMRSEKEIADQKKSVKDCGKSVEKLDEVVKESSSNAAGAVGLTEKDYSAKAAKQALDALAKDKGKIKGPAQSLRDAAKKLANAAKQKSK